MYLNYRGFYGVVDGDTESYAESESGDGVEVGQRSGFAHDSRTYNLMMGILEKARRFETMVVVLEEMGEKGLLTVETFEIAIKAFAATQERRKAVEIFELMKKYKFKVRVDTINCLLDALGKAKLGKEAQTLFEKLNERFTPNLQTYAILLNGWCRVKNLMEAGILFCKSFSCTN